MISNKICIQMAAKRWSNPKKQKYNSFTQTTYLFKADQLDSLKIFCILSENVIFHE